MLLKPWHQLPSSMQQDDIKGYYDYLSHRKGSLLLKRSFDIVVSALLIVLLLPVFLILSLWIKLDSQGPVFYRQERLTQYGKIFRIFKFRTMVVHADQIGSLVTTKQDARITKVGQKIRKYRLDELPQIFNIFLGDMSFVGTRPEVQKYVDAYQTEMLATLLLPSGVTSLASIRFKDEDALISEYVDETHTIDDVYIQKVLPEKMQYNLSYLKSFSFMGDIKLMIETFFAVLR